MASSQGSSKKKPYGAVIILGIVSFALYAVLLTQQEVVNEYFTKGGVYAFLPIAAAFLFSLVHGNFTGNFWTVLGVEASKKKKEVK
jgi:drug/metabolite transporter superfamily protein YnfA